MNSLLQIIKYVLKRKKFYLIPILLFSVFIWIFIISIEGTAIAPFIYPIF